MIEFAYNNSFQFSIGMAPYEALYGRKCHTPPLWAEVGERRLLGPTFFDDVTEKIWLIQDRLISAQDCQMRYFDASHQSVE
ncbi:hypothetical protein, partial [Streptococcus anginosus]|uniref:hypothetical protein n=1 Tax=Streptococcus anginosus TaxID=1328 RepID=UPI002ED88682